MCLEAVENAAFVAGEVWLSPFTGLPSHPSTTTVIDPISLAKINRSPLPASPSAHPATLPIANLSIPHDPSMHRGMPLRVEDVINFIAGMFSQMLDDMMVQGDPFGHG